MTERKSGSPTKKPASARLGSAAPRQYHAPVWGEPVIMEMGYPGRRGQVFPMPERKVGKAVGTAADLVPAAMQRRDRPALPELSEP